MKLKNWLFIWSKNNYINIKEHTKDIYEYQTNLIIKYLGDKNVEDIDVEILQKFVLHLAHQNYSTSTISTTFRLLKSCIMAYIEKYDTKYIKIDSVKLPNTKENKINSFSVKEQKIIENNLNIKKYPKQIGILISLYTGLRLGELLALKWENVDFENHIIYVQNTVYYKDKHFIYTTPKTKSSIRMIPIPNFLISILKSIKRSNKSAFVISNKLGNPIIPRTYQREFSAILKKCGLSHQGFHSLRHTFATRAIECGMDVKSLADILGHSNPMITLKRYTHSMWDYKKQMLNKLGKLYIA